jgi:hypothetical protein
MISATTKLFLTLFQHGWLVYLSICTEFSCSCIEGNLFCLLRIEYEIGLVPSHSSYCGLSFPIFQFRNIVNIMLYFWGAWYCGWYCGVWATACDFSISANIAFASDKVRVGSATAETPNALLLDYQYPTHLSMIVDTS